MVRQPVQKKEINDFMPVHLSLKTDVKSYPAHMAELGKYIDCPDYESCSHILDHEHKASIQY